MKKNIFVFVSFIMFFTGCAINQPSVSSSTETSLTTTSPTTVATIPSNQQVLSWEGVWMRTGENKYTSPTINYNQSTWETLTINSPPESLILTVTFTASSGRLDYGYATVINGSKSTTSSNIIASVSGTDTRTISYNIPPGRHQIHFGYARSGSTSTGNDNVTVEVTIVQ